MARRKKIEKKKKTLKRINYIIGILIVILILEIIIGLCSKYLVVKKSIYFDGLNSIININDGYATVGSNNNNDNSYERAKFTIYDSKRNKVVEKVYNKGYNSAFFDTKEDSDGNYIVVGSYEKTKYEHNNSIREGLIVKYDKDGNILFDHNFKILDNSKFTSVVCVEDGYIITGQSIYSNTKVGSSNEGGAILIKYNNDGKMMWYKNFGSSKTAIYNSLLIYNNEIYVVGKDANRVGIINKYDLDGNILLTNDYKYTDASGFTGIVEDNDYLFVATGKRITNSDTDAMIVKYDTDLTYIKEKVYSDVDNERFNKIIKDENNYLILIGVKAIAEKKKSTDVSDTNYNGFIAKYNDKLDEKAIVSYGDEEDDYFNGIISDDNGYLVVGYSSSNDGNYYSKFIKYSDALKVLVSE